MPVLANNANFSPAWKPGEKIEELYRCHWWELRNWRTS
jgi:Ni/Co efflux regulator RcnB